MCVTWWDPFVVSLIKRYRVAWSGGATVGPGVSTFYFPTTDVGVPTAVHNFFASIAGLFRPDSTWSFPNGGEVLVVEDGTLDSAWSEGTAPANVVGSNSGGGMAEGVGCRVVWTTTGIVGGRHVKGSTFLTSLNASNYGVDGLLITSSQTTIATAAATLLTTVNMGVYSRERLADPDHVPPIAHRDGAISLVTGAQVPRSVSWLKSRRT